MVVEPYDELISAPPVPLMRSHAAPWVAASAHLLLGDVAEARATIGTCALQHARDFHEQAGIRFTTMAVERDIGALLVRTDNPRRSVEVLTPLLEQWYAAGDALDWTSVVCMLALPLAELRHHELAALLIGWAEQRQGSGLSVTTVTANDLDAVADHVRVELGEERFEVPDRRLRPAVLGRAPASAVTDIRTILTAGRP